MKDDSFLGKVFGEWFDVTILLMLMYISFVSGAVYERGLYESLVPVMVVAPGLFILFLMVRQRK